MFELKLNNKNKTNCDIVFFIQVFSSFLDKESIDFTKATVHAHRFIIIVTTQHR